MCQRLNYFTYTYNVAFTFHSIEVTKSVHSDIRLKRFVKFVFNSKLIVSP